MHSNVHCRCSIVLRLHSKPDRPTNKPTKLLCCFVSESSSCFYTRKFFCQFFLLFRCNSLNCHHHRPDGAIAQCTQQICVCSKPVTKHKMCVSTFCLFGCGQIHIKNWMSMRWQVFVLYLPHRPTHSHAGKEKQTVGYTNSQTKNDSETHFAHYFGWLHV